MHEPPLLTTELVLRLERHVAPRETAPGQSPQVVRIGNTLARKVQGPWPTSAVFCFGASDVERLDEILDFFDDIVPLFYLAPGGFTREVAQALSDAGYFQVDWRQAILYGLPDAEPPPHDPDITVEKVTAETIETAAEVAAQGNGWGAEWREGAKDGVRKKLGHPSTRLYLARYRGEAAGIAELSLGTNDGMCALCNGAVVPRFRCKGVHAALLRSRLYEAAKLGRELVVGNADFGSGSFRNQQRVGLRLGYLECTWRKRDSR